MPRVPYQGIWWFYGNEPQGDAKILFQNMIRALGLVKNEWMWKGASKSLSQMGIPELPVVAVAFGGSVAQKITGEKDPLTELRQTVLALIANASAPEFAAKRASPSSRIPLMMSFPPQSFLIHSTSPQLRLGSNCSAV